MRIREVLLGAIRKKWKIIYYAYKTYETGSSYVWAFNVAIISKYKVMVDGIELDSPCGCVFKEVKIVD